MAPNSLFTPECKTRSRSATFPATPANSPQFDVATIKSPVAKLDFKEECKDSTSKVGSPISRMRRNKAALRLAVSGLGRPKSSVTKSNPIMHSLSKEDSSVHKKSSVLGISQKSKPSTKVNVTKGRSTSCFPSSLESALRLDDLDLGLFSSPVLPSKTLSVIAGPSAKTEPTEHLMRLRHQRKLEEKFDRACEQASKLNRRIESLTERHRYLVSVEQRPLPAPIKLFLAAMKQARDAFLMYADSVQRQMDSLSAEMAQIDNVNHNTSLR